ncbi:MAG: hypothetical protein U9P73_10530 [Candidatus Cloacimonadota bacterium]|nr:hypothetical protein [Candidatus Cloacimonadota bacterium]
MKKIILIILLILACNTFAENTENEILKRRANRYRVRKQYEKAISLYETIVKNDPDDIVNIRELILILIQVSKIDKAEKLLNTYKKKMREDLHFQLTLMILLHKAEFNEAKRLSNKILDKQIGNISNYGTIAKVFEQYRQYEIAIEIYLKARKIAGDENLYVRELANDHHALKNHKNAVREFVRLAENRNSYAAFILSRFKSMLKEDISVIRYIKDTAGKSENPTIKEIYALCLGEIGEYEKALQEYEHLPAKNLLKFADHVEKNGKADVAIRAYNMFLNRSVNIIENAKTMIRLTNIYIIQNELKKAEEILLNLYHNKDLKLKRNRYKTRANRQCRELLAQINLMRNASPKEIIQYLEEAKDFTFNKNDIDEIEYKIINLLIMNENNDLAKEKLINILKNENSGSDIFKKGYYYSFLIAIMTNDTKSDSLLSELLINIPEDDITNDALLLFQYLNLLQQTKDQEDFLRAIRKWNLYQRSDAIDVLRSIYERSELEEMLFLAGEWAMQTGKMELASEIFSHKYSKPDLQQYAVLKLVEIEKDKTKKKSYSRGFLQNNPQSIFSPQFRRILVNE